ncbi:MAG TPA: bifunctional DNA-formamidopyrimidine glycosylase/DNA-(apurinic or apyrimidinic site) lyase [Geobacteraceae bacterium]
MPELPEVETTRRGIASHLMGRIMTGAVVRAAKLRLPLTPDLPHQLAGQRIEAVERRGKYLLFECAGGTLLIHLGMTGHLRVVPLASPVGPHDRVDILLDDGNLLRLVDSRKFGTVLWLVGDPMAHPLLVALGPEPLTESFTGSYLYTVSRGRAVAIKSLLMDNRVVVGVGNIYANEALFRAGVRPETPAGQLTQARCRRLATAVKDVLAEAIELGGTTLQEFVVNEERPGYFRLRLAVYDRAGEPCPGCGSPIRLSRLAGRATYWCASCQR